jgi:long-chain acyl-CoA synthetase
MATVRPAEGDTFAKILEWNAANRGKRPAIREKHLGIWQTWSWSMVREEVRTIAHGLADLGLKRGDKIAIIGDNRPRLYWSIVAAQSLGAIPVPMYQDAAANELQFVVDHAEVRFAVAEDQEQIDKLMEAMEACDSLEQLIYSDPRGMRNYKEDFIHSFDSLEERGRAHQQANPSFYDDEMAKTGSDDTAIFLYTSGTTGNPKGVVLTYENLVSMGKMSVELEQLKEDEDTLAYLPLAWVGDNIFSIAQSYVAGFCVNCPESQTTVLQDLREIGPTYFFAPPRIFENLLTTVHVRMEDSGRLKRTLFERSMKLARRVGVAKLNGQPVSVIDRIRYGLGHLFAFGPLKNTLGFSRIRRVYTAGEAIGPEIFDFYRALGLNMKQLYGQTESTV